mmetsp:Transcript_24572/g.60740  ORF Transcript_24572/g.60740 Transcript_24572/m.60740 type:complete len:281 (+) Transcript_24572:810-1652(+)
MDALQLLVVLIFDGQRSNKEVGRVAVGRHRHAQLGEVGDGVVAAPEVDQSAVGQQHQLIEEVVDLGGRLVDGGNHRAPGLSDFFEHFHHIQSQMRVKSTRGFVNQQQRGVGEDLSGTAEALPLTPRDAPSLSDEGVLALEQAQPMQHRIHLLLLLTVGQRARQPHASLVHEVFLDGQVGEEEVLLLHIGRLLDERRVDRPPVGEDLAAAARHASRQYVEQSRLACAAGAHHSNQFARLQPDSNVIQDALGLRHCGGRAADTATIPEPPLLLGLHRHLHIN